MREPETRLFSRRNSWQFDRENTVAMRLPTIIQGGMGVSVSNWRLARAVSRTGQLGVVSGTALDQVLVRRLQDGDAGGHIRRALDHFPFPAMAERIWTGFHIPGGKAPLASYARLAQHEKDDPRELRELCIAANFVEVFLAREGHGNAVGINYLEKIQIPHLPSIYGAMLAGADYVLMGAGIPARLPGVLDLFIHHQAAFYPLHVSGAGPDDDATMTFDPREYMERELPPLRRPLCLPVIASNTLATTLVKRANGHVDGFIIEGPTAGGHNAPPRGKMQLDAGGEPVYGERDVVDLAKMRELGLPFWLAGGYGSPEKVREALASGAAGVQVGTAFAFCAESGLRGEYKQAILAQALRGETRIKTDPVASPTGFPFKAVQLEETVSEADVYQARPRVCDLGYLREAYKTAEGGIGYRCSGEPVTAYVAKGGTAEDTAGRKCLCNALMANIGLAQVRSGKHVEKGLITAGDDVGGVIRFLPPSGKASYSAADVVAALLRE
jgi:nitronate monooxygenase